MSYQKTRSLTKNDKTPQIRGPSMGSSSGTSYAKVKPLSPLKVPDMNVSYGDTVDPTDLPDITGMDPQKAPKNPPRGFKMDGSPKGKKFK
jgi:hypothetical protein